MVMFLLFGFNTNSYAYQASDGGKRVATFLVTTDIGIIPCAANHYYSNIEVYSRSSNKIYTSRHIMYSYYNSWSGWALASLYNSTISKVNFYKSNNSYAGTSGILDKGYEMILPGDSKSIIARQKYFNFTISTNPAKAKTSFSLHCPGAVIPTSTKHTTVNLK